MAGALELGRRHAADLAHRRGKGHERGRHVELLEAAGHGVLAADGADAQVDLRHERAQHGCRGLAPTLRVAAQAFEVLLERQVHVLALEACRHQARDRFHHGNVRAGELVGLGEVGVEAPGHAAARGGLAAHGQLGHHGLRRRQLVLAAEGHEHRGRADGRVEALGQALVRAYVQVGDQGIHALRKGVAFPRALVGARLAHMHGLLLRRAVACQELAAEVDDGVAVPHDAHARIVGDLGDYGGLEVLLTRVAQELVRRRRRRWRRPCAPATRRWPARCRPGPRTSSAPCSG